jgi:type IV pilus assembly protein PilC
LVSAKRLTDLTHKKSVRHISQRDFLHIFQRLAMLLTAGVPQSTAILILYDQTSNERQKLYLKHLHAEVIKGRLLSKVLADQVVAPLAFKTLISLGEQTGTLPKQMTTAVGELLALRQSKQQIMTSLLYPAILLILTMSITLFLLVGVFPKITPVFSTLRAELPLSTRILMSTSSWLGDYGLWLLLLMVVGGVIFWIFIQRSSWLARRATAISMSIPVLRYIIRTWNIIQIVRMLAVLLESGVRGSDAVALVSQHIHNPLYKSTLKQISGELVLGRKLSDLFGHHKKLFPSDMVGLVQVAEQSGSLPKTCAMVAELYAQDLDVYHKKLTTLIEPILMIIMGLTIGFIAVSIITPLYGLTNALSQ